MRLPSTLLDLATALRGARACAGVGRPGRCLRRQAHRPPVRARHDADGRHQGSVATITSPALQCPSRICLLPGAENGNTANRDRCAPPAANRTGLRRRRDRRQEQPGRPPLQERLRLHVADDGRQLLLPAVLRLPRLHVTEPAGRHVKPPHRVSVFSSVGRSQPPTSNAFGHVNDVGLTPVVPEGDGDDVEAISLGRRCLRVEIEARRANHARLLAAA